VIVRLVAAMVLPLAKAAAAEPVAPTSSPASVLVGGGTMMNGSHFADSVLPGLREHFRGCRRVALVLHATHPAERDKMEARLRLAFAHLGVPEAESLHRHDAAGARRLLATADAIFVGGGETFALLAELHRTGQLAHIRERVKAGVPYAGSSAGANVAGMLIGTTNDFPVTDVPSREALELLPFTINPHHPLPAEKEDFAARAGKIEIYLKFNPDEAVLGLANAAMVRLHAGRTTVAAGTAWVYTATGVREFTVGERLAMPGRDAAR
jgi:dipeptidase E